ncbi:peptide deformylase [Hydrogenobaculum acidophilum]
MQRSPLIYDILIYPNPILKEKSKDVGQIDDGIITHIENLKETMYSKDFCTGIASSQVGILKNIIVMDASRFRKPPKTHHGLLTLINPTIIKAEDSIIFREGCLSIPEYTANIQRYKYITIKALDEKENEIILDLEGPEAVLFQHELDHLNGVLFLDRLTSLDNLFKRKT